MTALLLFPVCAIIWMMVNAKLGLVQDQPPMLEEAPAQPVPAEAWEGLPAAVDRA
jgi:hypothetical protein